IVDQAVEALEPSKPRSSLILALSGVLGVMLGVVYVFIRRAMQRGVLEPGEVEREVGLATYASIPFSPLERKLDRLRIRKKAEGGQSLLAITHPQDVCTEALRSLRTALHFALLDAPNRMVVITGPSPGLGKSFVSLNFAAVLAEAGQRVLVVDADLRRGHMHRIVGVPRAPGLTDCLSESSTLAESIHAVEEQPGLYFLTTGTLPPNPSELLMGEHFKEILAHIQHRFDYIIFDTPPVLAVTDAAIIGRLAGTTLMLLKEGEHPVPVLKDSLQRLRQGGVSVRGVVFNMVGRTPGKYGGHYGYRYGYTYTYKSVKK
ncbi:MAG: polysaccharide biosynthesis tyrosine autokinase, partial [Algiphilus sp.]